MIAGAVEPAMTISEARIATRLPLQFGNPLQIEAARILGLRLELDRLCDEYGMSAICGVQRCRATGKVQECRHGALDQWDEEILEAQIARFRLLHEDGPDLTGDQIEALERS